MANALSVPADILSSFRDAFAAGITGFVTAGRIYAKAIDDCGPQAREEFAAAFPTMRPSLWRRLEALGRGTMDERLLLNGTSGANALSRLSAPMQKEALDNGVDLLTSTGDTLRVQVDHLTSDQAAQVFALDHVRSLEEQRAYLEAKAPLVIREPKTRQKSWRVVNGKVRITHPCELSRVDLANMLAEMG